MERKTSSNAFLALRALAFVFLLPGTFAVYAPLQILRATGRLLPPSFSVSSLAASVLLLAGAAVVLRCVWDFFAAGRGTLAPVDPPKRLVVAGLYRFTRNPMYNGVLAAILGEAWLFRAPVLLFYAFCVLTGFHLFVVLYEERTLAGRFGHEYASYRRRVPRWGFVIRPEPGEL
ncbi:MAG: methyltransferase family protein [Thermoanaerobaculia bacterium]